MKNRSFRTWAARGLLAAVATGVGVAAGLANRAEAVPIPSPVYDILTTSGTHQGSLLNLGLGQPGVPQVPTPVDVDGDLLPDVTVAVNLVDANGAINNPPDVGEILVPNVEINRILTGSLLGQPLPPLRIEVRLRLMDVGGDAPDTFIRFGYDTGPGGSIPPAFKAQLGGLENFFNPLVATVDTGPSAGRPTTYDGPLRLVGGIDSGDSHVDLGLGFAPLPSSLEVTYASDDAGQHITYAHSAPREVDARADIDFVDSEGELHVDARIDRLPSSIAVDIAEGGSDSGAIEYRSNSDGRRPDADIHVESIGSRDDDEPLYADIDLESLPPEMGAEWSLPTDGPIDVAFTTGDDDRGHGVGGVDVDIRNHPASHPDAIDTYVPTQQQYLSVAQDAADDGSVLRRISGRVERVRAVSFSDADGVMNADVSMGDGEQPLEISYDCRVECSEDGATRLIDVDTTVSPLPDSFSVGITDAGDDPRVAPMLIDYTASQPADVEASIDLAQAGSTGSSIICGAARTMCADVEVRDLPSELHASLGQYTSDHDEGEVPEEADLRLAVDLGDEDPDTPNLAPDLDATVVLGPENPGERPLVADAQALGLPQHTRVYLHQHRESTDEGDALALDRAAFHACDRAVDADVCTGTPGEIGAITVSLRTFLERPAGFPVPLYDRPQYASVHGRPSGLEVGARVEHVRDLEYVNTGPLQGVFASAGDSETPFTARIDLQDLPGDDVDLGPDENGDGQTLTGVTTDLRADAEVSILPPSFGVCFRTPNETLIEADKAFTEACENSELDGDPLAFAYALDVEPTDTIEVVGTFATTVGGTIDGGIRDGDDHSETMEGEATVPDVPDSVIVQASLPEEDTVGPIDAIYDASGTLDIDFAARMLLNDSRCLDPRPHAEAMCVEAYLADIPSFATVHYDPTDTDDNLAVHTEYPPDQALGDRMNIDDIRLSSVSPRVESVDEPFETPNVLIVEGDVVDLPTDVHGTIVLTDDDGDDDVATQPAKTMVVCAAAVPCDEATPEDTGSIGRVTLDVRNQIVADPTPLGGVGEVPDQRASLPDPTEQILVFQRGRAFHAFIDIGDVAGGGYRQVPGPDGQRLETDELLLGFGESDEDDPPVIRAYADLDFGTSRTIADVTLQDVPAAARMCFRGVDPTEGQAPDPDPVLSRATACDDPEGLAAEPGAEGAIQLLTDGGADGSELDIDAFVRQSTGGDAQVVSGLVHIENLPARVEGTVPGAGTGSLDLAGYDAGGAPDGIDGLQFEVANFDLENLGYDQVPWTRTVGAPSEDFPAEALAGQHLSLVSTDVGFHARGRLDGLRRIALRDDLCAPFESAPGTVRADYPYYPDAAPGTSPYTCARVEIADDGGAVGQPFNVKAFTRDGPDIMSLDDAGLTSLFRSLQLTLADRPVLDPARNNALLDPCAPHVEVVVAHSDCASPLIRVDVDGVPDPDGNPPQLFGSLRMGSQDHLDELDLVDARGGPLGAMTFEDLDVQPAEGARVKIGTWSDVAGFEDVEEGTAVIAHLRMVLPASFTLDAPQTWSEIEPNTLTPTLKATDLRMHYVARDPDGNVIPSLGDLKLLAHSAPESSQTLVSGGGIGDGVAIPGELALAVYLRDDVAGESMFAQIDGVVSTDVSLTAVMLAGTPPLDPDAAADAGYEPPPDRMTFQILDLPATGPFTEWDEPGFRIQAQVADDSPPAEDCSTTSCSESRSTLQEVRAVIDLRPDGVSQADRAHLVQAVVRTLHEGPTGVQIAAYKDVHDDGTAGTFDDGDAEISFEARLVLDPLYVYAFSGVPFLANYELVLDADMEVGLTANRVRNFQLFNEAIGMVGNVNGSGEAYIGPINLRPSQLYLDVTFLGATVFGLELPPFRDPDEPLAMNFPECDGGSIAGGIVADFFGNGGVQTVLENLPLDERYGFEIVPGERTDVVAFPQINTPPGVGEGLDPVGPGGFIADVLPGLGNAIGCALFDPSEVDLITPGVPGVTLPVPNHVVPGGEDDAIDPPPTVVDTPVPSGDDTLADAEVCGRLSYPGRVTIEGTITVADHAIDGACAAADVGRLEIAADEIIVEGTIEADAVVDTSCTDIVNYSTTYDFGHDGFEVPPPILAQTVAGQFCDSYMGSGAGAGHVNDGGISFGSFGRAYDDRDDAGLATAGWQGGDGSTSNGGGRGGGVVRLVGSRVEINGTISANGEAGDSVSDDDCAAIPPQVGSGGGSGGGIVVLAQRVEFGGGTQLIADGGAGGGGQAGGGGGAAGDIEVRAPIITPAPGMSLVPGMGGGSACLPGWFGGLGQSHAAEEPQSSVLGFASEANSIWFTTNDVDDGDDRIEVPFVAAAHDPLNPYSATSDKGMTVALCAVPMHPSVEHYEQGFRILTPDTRVSFDPCGAKSLFGAALPTGILLDHVYLEDNDVTLADGQVMYIEGDDLPFSGYFGLYTVAITSSIPDNDCLSGDESVDELACFAATSSDPDNSCYDHHDWLDLGVPAGFSFFFDGLQYDRSVCTYPNIERMPGEVGPDVVIGVDNDAPQFGLQPGDIPVLFDTYDPAQQAAPDATLWTNRHSISGTVTARDHIEDTQLDISGVSEFICFEDTPNKPRHLLACGEDGSWIGSLSDGDGQKTIVFVAIDEVGNRTYLANNQVIIDTVAPDSAITATPAEGDLENDWYSTSPALELSGFENPVGPLESPAHPDHRYLYQIDDGSELPCQPEGGAGDTTCSLSVLPGPGTHLVHFTAIDAAGNRDVRDPDDDAEDDPNQQVMGSIEIGIDHEAPFADSFAAPGLPDGTHDWYRTEPWIGVGFGDPPVGGAGINLDREPSVLDVERVGPGNPIGFQGYTGPFQLGAGTHQVTARARDDAGNPWLLPPAVGPTREYRVDPSAPAVTLSVAGPLGSGGWYTGPATVTVGTFDLPIVGGSGVNPDFAGSGLFVSVDGGPFLPFTPGPVVLGEGEHVVRAYAVDVAGNRSPVAERFVDVDRSHPVSVLRTVPADPARAPWFRTRPAVVLRATDGDANAGVTAVRYCFGTGCIPSVTYTGPITPAAGTTVLRWQALDASGAANHEPIRQATLRSDETPPAPVATKASTLIWSRLLGPSSIQLRFTVQDNLAGPLRATVVIYDVLGNPVRRIDAAPINVNAGQVVNGSVNWDGRIQGLGALVPLGVYHYRVVLTDQAGNIAQSGESKPITIRLL